VGAVATQSFLYTGHGPAILDALARGERPQAAIDAALANDKQAPQRQLGVVHADGQAASYTGKECMEWAGSRTGPNFAVQGNILAGEKVVEAMARGFTESSGSLPERLMDALEAGQAAGGDKRGQQSAGLIVEQVGWKDAGGEGVDRLVDLRVDDHAQPIRELRRLLGMWQIEEANNIAMAHYGNKEYAAAVEVLKKSNARTPGDARTLYNLACFESLAGMTAEGLAHLKQSIAKDPSFREMAKVDGDFASVKSLPAFEKLMAARPAAKKTASPKRKASPRKKSARRK
jgi:uncharacterized Ntn-hydrolase superfamily protein